jgi:hypothetical protein
MRFACLLPVLILVALRTLSHANPTPLPWASGVFDAQGLDDILQTIRVPYTGSPDAHHVVHRAFATPTDRVSMWEPSVAPGPVLTTAQSRAPPSS